MKQLWEDLKKNFWLMLFVFVVGVLGGKFLAMESIISDCKVLGMTRFGNVPMGCRIGEKYQ